MDRDTKSIIIIPVLFCCGLGLMFGILLYVSLILDMVLRLNGSAFIEIEVIDPDIVKAYHKLFSFSTIIFCLSLFIGPKLEDML